MAPRWEAASGLPAARENRRVPPEVAPCTKGAVLAPARLVPAGGAATRSCPRGGSPLAEEDRPLCVSLRTTRRAVWVPRGGVPECFYGHLRCLLPSGAVLAAPSPARNVTEGPWVDLGADFVCSGSCPVHLELGSAEPWGQDWFWAPCRGGSRGSGGAAGGPQPSLRGSLCPQACCRQGSAWQLPGGHQAGEGGGGAGQRREATRRGGGEPRCVPGAWGQTPARGAVGPVG